MHIFKTRKERLKFNTALTRRPVLYRNVIMASLVGNLTRKILMTDSIQKAAWYFQKKVIYHNYFYLGNFTTVVKHHGMSGEPLASFLGLDNNVSLLLTYSYINN